MSESVKPKFDPRGAISRGKIAQPLRILIYGVEGIGKSTTAAKAPRPLILGTEDGTAHLDVARVTPDGWLTGERPLLDLVSWFATPDASDYQTLVIDTADMAERLCVEYCCRRDHDTPEPTKKYNRTTWVDGKPTLDGYGYGAGNKVVESEFLALLAALDRARRARNVHVVFTAHADVAKEKNAGGDDYGIIAPKLIKQVREQLTAWCDAVLYCQYAYNVLQPGTHEKGKQVAKAKVVTDEERIVHTQRDGAFLAKNRLGLPKVIDMEWSTIAKHAQAAYGDATTQLAQLREEIDLLLPLVAEDVRTKAQAAVEKHATSVLMLVDIKGRLQARVLAAAPERAERLTFSAVPPTDTTEE